MELTSIECLVRRIKDDVFSSSSFFSFVPTASAYDAAWVGMIPHPCNPSRPMFPECMDWVLHNQNNGGFWGEPENYLPTYECLTSTLACMAMLKTWDLGSYHIQDGLRFLRANSERLVLMHHNQWPRWFAIVFPGMLELAYTKGLDVFPHGYPDAVKDLFKERERILEMEASSGVEGLNRSLTLYLEALPASYKERYELILAHESTDGSLFQSPSATASAFMLTKSKCFSEYLNALVHTCGGGVPLMYPVDEDYLKLKLVDHLERLGCSEYFSEEIESVLNHAYSNWEIEKSEAVGKYNAPFQLLKDSLAFTLLRKHGYHVSPGRFCWFVQDGSMLSYMEENYIQFLGAMSGVYKASHFMFPQETELQNARDFSEKILQKGLLSRNLEDGLTNFKEEMEHEMKLPWLARMDHLEHRTYIERGDHCYLWIGKTSPYRFSHSNSSMLFQLATKCFMERQSVYRAELEQLKRWSKDTGLSNMGFGREKTTYTYFAAAATTRLPLTSDVRLVVAKSAIIITIADDFFDEKGSVDELSNLTKAVQRWNRDGLSGLGKTIFNALDELVNEIAYKAFSQQGHNIKKFLQEIWRDAFKAWLKEAEWSRRRDAPSIEEYIKVGMISIAVHAIVLPACYLACSNLPSMSSNAPYSKVTELLMVLTRLLNDLQSYQKEKDQGKLNMVLLYLNENPTADIKDSIAHITRILDSKKKEIFELVLSENSLPEEWRALHLSCLKAFQMFFNSSNAYDSPTAVLESIQMAFYDPLVEPKQSSTLLEPPLQLRGRVSRDQEITIRFEDMRRGNALPIVPKCQIKVNDKTSHGIRGVQLEVKRSISFLRAKTLKASFRPSVFASSPPVGTKSLLWM